MFKKLLSIVFLSVLINACSSDRTDDPLSLVDDFDRGSMLTNLSDNIIIPSYEDFAAKMTSMKNAGKLSQLHLTKIHLSNLELLG